MFQVFIDGPLDGSPGGVERLAEAMHERYGIPVADLIPRLERGGFRVKASVDHTSARAYERDLERLGARVAIVEVGAPPRPPAERPAAASRSERVPRAPRTATPGTGLAAAAASPSPPLQLESLESLTLATLDGQAVPDAPGAPRGAFSPPAEPARAAEVAGPVSAPPIDLFASPEMAAPEPALELAPDDLAHQAQRRAPSPHAPVARDAAPVPPARPVAARDEVGASAAARVRSQPRARFAAGAVAAVVLGFVPAHVVADLRERSAFAAIDARVRAVQSRTEDPLASDELAAFRAAQHARKQRARRSIALTSLAIWALGIAGVSYVWFRRVPWDRLPRWPSLLGGR
jgi:hypothetical protein